MRERYYCEGEYILAWFGEQKNQGVWIQLTFFVCRIHSSCIPPPPLPQPSFLSAPWTVTCLLELRCHGDVLSVRWSSRCCEAACDLIFRHRPHHHHLTVQHPQPADIIWAFSVKYQPCLCLMRAKCFKRHVMFWDVVAMMQYGGDDGDRNGRCCRMRQRSWART